MSTGQSRSLLLFPCNGNAREALDAIGEQYRVLGFVDDAIERQGTGPYGWPVFGRRALQDHPDACILAVPGAPNSFLQRRAIIEGLGVADDRYATVVHPSAQVSKHAKIGRNVLIMAGVVITSNAVIGDHVCVLPNSVIHHDASVGDWSLVGAAVTVAGGTRIGRNCYIGSGASLINDIEIGDRALVGLGATVIASVPADMRVAGNPARRLAARASS
jgi:sugar O-acyltransferase (sialic acid O-acetyltransferase NeuD family)